MLEVCAGMRFGFVGPCFFGDLLKGRQRKLTILGSTMGSDKDFRQMLKAVTAAKLKPVIDSVIPLVDVKDAIDAVLEGKQVTAEQKPSMGCNIKWMVRVYKPQPVFQSA
jgi:NADPH:quinone reductase-like Zn-dependent oxidoreductase